MTSMRKIYQKAIVTPTHHVDVLWKDYETFENSVSRTLVRRLEKIIFEVVTIN